MISALAWVPKGASRPTPKHAEPSADELEEIKEQLQRKAERGLLGDGEDGMTEEEGSSEEMEEAGEQAGSSSEEEEEGSAGAVARARAVAAAVASSSGGSSKKKGGSKAATDDIEASLRELDMDHYDDDDGPNLVSRGVSGQALDVYPEEDPYMTGGGGDSEDDSEKADLEIKPTDLVIMAARNEDDVSTLELWVYEEAETVGDEANVYVHHELMLPAFPLCLAWLDCPIVRQHGSGDASTSAPNPDSRGNFVAIGSMEPGIEIWDLDIIDAVEPAATLGGVDKAAAEAAFAEAKEAAGWKLDKAKKKKLKDKVKKKGPAYLPGSHTDAVLGLSWNREYRNVLASASADNTVKVWDVARQTVEHTFKHHTDKVQAVAWNPVETPVLLTGGFDKLAALVDVRTPATQPAKWQLSADVESVLWSPHDPTHFLVSCEDGLVAVYDARKGAGSAPVFRLAAHDKPTCAMSFCPAAPGLLATAATDKKTKLWDISSGAPTLLATQDLQVGAVFTMGFSADAPHLLAVGGAMGSVVVWDVRANQDVVKRFPQLLPQQPLAS
mmetsp:Transcript_27260/g.73661  ORF Transcript_27260/g.73661 Transcript_27260/m.73661 type:complete len:555 (+) Transcript_27260:84-1748(+)